MNRRNKQEKNVREFNSDFQHSTADPNKKITCIQLSFESAIETSIRLKDNLIFRICVWMDFSKKFVLKDNGE